MSRKFFFPLSDFYKNFFRERVWKISIDLGNPCVYGKCIYCNESSFIPPGLNGKSLKDQIVSGISLIGKRRNIKKFIAYLQPGTNTAVDPLELKEIFENIISFKKVVSISIGTRPDYLSDEILDVIKFFAKELPIFVEVGLQSSNNVTLKKIRRGHTFEDFLEGVLKLSKILNVLIVTHMTIGLPGEGRVEILNSFRKISDLPLNGVKIHHLQIVRGTPLERMYLKGNVKVFESVEQYIEVLVDVLEVLPPNFVIHRLYGDIPDNLLIAPNWKIDKNSFKLKLEETFLKRNSFQGRFFKGL